MNPKDRTSNQQHSYASMRKLFYTISDQSTFRGSSEYIHRKKAIAIGRQSLKPTVFFTQNNKREILQSKRRLRSR